MKLKNLMGAFLALAFAAAMPAAVRADVAAGDIYSINLVENALYGGRVPTEDSPLKIGEKTVIRVRLLNRRDPNTGDYKPWRFALRNESLEGYEEMVLGMMSPDLGLMLGGQPAYATFLEMKPLEGAENAYTDIFFEYTVQSGDLALPAQLMNAQGKPASSEISADYYLKNLLYWKISNDLGNEAVFHFRPEGGSDTPDIPGEPWEPTRYISGVGMGLFVKTIDFDRNYAKPAEMPTDEDVWRVFYAGETETTTLPPSIATEGGSPAERDTVMYVWSDDEKVVAPRKIDGAEEVSDTIGGKTYTRWVLPVTLAKAKSTVSFTLKAVTNAVGKTAHIRMSSSRNLIVDDMGVLVTNWVERTVEVTDPPEPYMSINFVDPAGNPISAVTASPDYQQYSAALIVKLNGKAPTVKTKVDIKIYNTAGTAAANEVTDKVIPADSAARRIGISTSSDPVDQPWGDRVLSVEFNPGETEKTLYVYALDPTLDIDTKLVFKPVEDMTEKVKAMLEKGDPSLGATEYPGTAKTGSLAVNGVKPAITSPAEGTAITGAMAGETYALDVTVASSYRNLNGQKGKWKLFFKSSAFGDNNWHSLTDQTVDSATGTMTANLTPTVAGKGLALEIYVIDPNGVVSDHVKMTIDVEKAKTAWAELDRADGEYAEGNERSAKAKFFISQPSESASPLYAFLRPLNDDASNCVASAAMTTATPSQGVLIEPGDTDSKNRTADIQLLDGRYPKTAAIFEVVICSSLAYDKANEKSYSPGQVYLNVTNVTPHVESVSMGGADIDRSGAIVADPIAQGVNKTFRISIGDSEPSLYDLEGTLEEGGIPGGEGDNRFCTAWKFGNESIDWECVYGNPNLVSTVTNHTFSAPGKQVIKVRVQDKDMRKTGKWSPEFTFTVEVLNKPSISITPAWEGKTTYDETETGPNASTFNVDLSVAPRFSNPNDKLVVELTVTPLGNAAKYSADDCVLSKTTLSFANGTKTGQSFYLKLLDGTSESAAAGFRITATATAESEALDIEKKTWDMGEIEINVLNENPEIQLPAEQPKDGDKVIPYVTTVGERLSLAWALRDVAPDTNTMTVTWTTSEGRKMTYIQGEGEDTETVKYLPDVMSGTHEFWFNSSGESKSITMMAQDKDGGVASRTVYYSIAASKTLEIVPHGPPSGNGTALSARYQDKASGLGAGRVWSKNPATIENWVFTFNCGLDSDWRIYGAGYTNGEEDVRSDPDFSYTYAPADGKDSFLYAWLQIVQEKDAAKPTDAYLAVVPEHRDAANSGTLINLPTEEAKNGGFANTIAEAIFAKEYLVSDNMGDINQDGVPDIYVKKYEFGVIDNEGNVAGDDLKAITVANENGNLDADFLPASGTSLYGSLIPGLKESWVTLGKPFDAVTEIRGYHEGLNDAPAQAGIADVTPDRIYAVDGEWRDGECTISYVEYLAWQEFAARTWPNDPGAWTNVAYWAKWSPERPTDPCNPDTDDDGFTDGYEYYFWYRAHVGYLDADGVHRYLTGRAYDPKNPGEGKFIDSATIASLMDPLAASGDAASAKTRDTDNDGLPDLLEFEIGTNPFDFDTDGDGLPDGFEICNVGNLNPLDPASHLDAKSDTERNSDGDAMAITSWKLEKNVYPTPFEEADKARGQLTTFAVIRADGMTDGVQWYAVRCAPGDVAVTATTNEAKSAWSFTADGRTFVTYTEPVRTADGRLAVTLAKDRTFVSTKPETVITNVTVAATNPDTGDPVLDPESGEPLMRELAFTNVYAGARYPVRLAPGLQIADVKVTKMVETTLAADIKAKDANACWIYGRGTARTEYGEVAETAADYGCLALGGQLEARNGLSVCALPDNTRDVAFLHYLVYQEFGFDPRTAWKAKDPLNVRWGKAEGGEAEEGIVMLRQGGYAGKPARTRDYSNYDEFLVYSFFLNNGCDMKGVTRITDSSAYAQIVTWDMFTTNPQGPDEKLPETSGETRVTSYGRGTNGADTDGDGVPDGWELYVMAGPKTAKGEFVFAPPYAGFATALSGGEKMPESYFSPFRAFAQGVETSNQIYLGGQANDDGLNQYQEFEGTDSIGYYAQVQTGNTSAYSTTIRHVGGWTWFNKFFPTDPWNVDTDGDTLSDAAERGVFGYGDVDTGKTCIPGGGLNPCSTDTDLDGLPDPWEAQYRGKTVYTGDKCQFAEGVDADGAAKTSTKATLQGYMDGMDGTVADAFSHPVEFTTGADGSSSNVTSYVVLNGVNEVVNRDYDHDGLENWQEYLSGTMRCWRYDDPISSWRSIPSDWYFAYNEATDTYDWLPQYEKFGLDPEADDVEDQFWYMTLVDTSSEWYNPHLVVDRNPSAQYFTRVTNGWDGAYTDAGLSGGKQPGAYYYIYNRCASGKIEDVWVKNGPLMLMDTGRTSPSKYIGCSPIDEDSDHDGMDDYYELFHGLNPLLGQEGVMLSDGGPCDLVFDAWQSQGVALWAWGSGSTANYWQLMRKGLARGTGFDFEVFPWLNGRQESDPDGDDVKNVEESLMARLEPETVWHHTDPTPLWMTDSTYSNSLVRQYFQMQAGLANAYPANFTFRHTDESTGETKVYRFRDFDGYMEAKDMMKRPIPVLGVFSADFWKVSGTDTINWMYSFEENEGFDSDHDGLSDHEEIESKFRSATEPQDADSPRRRQAMYFQGPARPSALQTPPFVHENHPVGATSYPTDPSFLQYTVECWVMPEARPDGTLADATIIERAVYSGATNPGDEEYMRCNFQLAVRNGKWYTKFDPNGTVRGNQVEIFSAKAASVGTWTHLAATYDGRYLRFYVNGEAEIPVESGLAPAYGSNAIALQENSAFWFDREHPLHSILVGASFRTNGDGVRDGNALDLTLGLGWSRYKDFFTGYVDEIRIWDGARRADEIGKAMNVRFGANEAKQNRNEFYDAWSQGKYRYADDGQGSSATVPAELRFHWTFDSVFGAENEREVAKAPHGFDVGKAPLSRPVGYGISWWMDVLAGYTGTVYSNPAWVTWIPNTVTHLPRFDGTTLDSFYWSDDFKGDESGKWTFTKVAEPVSRWTQVLRNGVTTAADYRSTDTRHRFVNEYDATGSRFSRLYEFTGRNLNLMGDDLLPLGGAYVKYVPNDPGLWDGQGASTTWEITGADADGDGLPNWWETYAEQNYREGLDQSEKLDWNSDVNYRGVIMKAGTAYLRDLAKGIYVDADGKLHSDLPTQFAQTADEDRNGIPDWWEDVYGIRGEAGLADHDNDGLPNYVEYLLSEVFDFNILFSPVNPRSANLTVPDYFYRVGELYVGEIFTDHDLVDDSWEDVYPASFASRLAWDADADVDEDGWSNRSENRYSKAVMPIIADQRTHYTAADGLVADYPIPTLTLKLRYNGNRQQTVSDAPVAVQVTTDRKLVKDPDAVFMIGAGEKTPGDTGTDTKKDDKSATASAETTKTRTIGKWSNRHAIGTLTPGNIKQNSLALEFCYDPSSVMYSWRTLDYLPDGTMRWTDKRGTRLEYDTDKRKYGEENVELLAADTSYAQLKDLEIRAGEDSSTAVWVHTKSGQELGKVNLVTGEFDLNLGVFAGQYVENGTNAADYVSLEDQTFRIAYTANPSVGLPRELYLGAADKGFVKEGRNTIMAWAETVAADGVWQPGEPYGMVRDVDVSWKGTAVEIELTDASPVTPRIDLVADDAMPRVTRADIRGRIEAHPDLNTSTILNWLDGNPIADRAAEGESFRGQRVRVVRWMINDVPVFLANTDAKVVLDKTVETDVRGCLTEADFLVGNESFDIDWDDLSGILDDVREACGVVTNVSYLVVVGDGDVDWNDFDTSNTVYALNTVITRKFGRTRVKPVAVSPGVTDSGIVYSANPTFKWTMACPEDEGYTAFNVQVMDGSTLIYDSGKQLAPPRNSRGEYEWSAPLYVGDKTTSGKVFENKTVYTWKVSMYNAKFSNTAVYSDAGKFRMEVQTNATSCGTANVAVRYFGPSESYTKKTPVVRVQAFTSPDFTGQPVAAGFVKDMTTLADANGEVTANCHVIGLEPGSYYLQAFIDSNGNGVCDRWETQGYLCARDGSTADWLNPTAITFDTAVGPGDLAVIYLEDADTDGDGLPDAWEWANASDAGRANGSFLGEKDVEELSETKAGEFVVNAKLSGAMKLQENALAPTAGLAGRLAGSGLMSNAGVLALAMGAPTEGYDSFAAAIRGYVSPELVEDGVRISSLDLVDGKVSIKVEAETETAGSAWVKGRKDLTVWCQVQWKQSLTGTDWLPLGEPFEITVGTAEAEEIDISDRVPEGDSGYFSVKLYKK